MARKIWIAVLLAALVGVGGLLLRVQAQEQEEKQEQKQEQVYQRWRRHLVWVERFAGVMLVTVGVLVFFDLLAELSVYLIWFN